MAVSNAVKVKRKNIKSVDVTSFADGLDQRGAENTSIDSISYGRNVMVDSRNLLTYRYGLEAWLPDTVGTVNEVFPALYNGEEYYFIADDGKVKYCKDGDIAWTNCRGTNVVTTTNGVITTFIRVQDFLLILNNTDKTRYIDLSTKNMVQATFVADPTAAPTAAVTGITGTGTAKVYYAIGWNTPTGNTAISPILTQTVSKNRSMWKTDGTEYITVTRNNTPPAKATSWNLYAATAAAGGTIQASDMLLMQGGIDLSTTTFMDTGIISLDISQGTAPEDNSTDGFIAQYGIEVEGRPILYGIVGDEYAVRMGGDGEHPMDFSPTNGGYRAVLNKGTNYYPMSIVGWRNGQGIPSLTVLFSNTQGRSKQSVLEQQTITYGTFTFVVWGVTEQNYGAAGVSSPYAVVNNNGMLVFPTSAGFNKMDTEASMQNVISTKFIDQKIKETMSSISPSLLNKVVGAGWADKLYFTIPSRGYTYNNQIAVYDVSNKDRPKWYIFDIRAQWLGVISPDTETAFVYVCQDNHIYKLKPAYATFDTLSDGTTQPFPIEASGPLQGFNDAHTAFNAIIQVVFYLVEALGEIEVGISYLNKNGKVKTKTKKVNLGSYQASYDGGWSSTEYLFNDSVGGTALTWDELSPISNVETAEKRKKRQKMRMRVITNEAQWFIRTGIGYNAVTLRSVSYESISLGVDADLR